jgi:hypothetical protein
MKYRFHFECVDLKPQDVEEISESMHNRMSLSLTIPQGCIIVQNATRARDSRQSVSRLLLIRRVEIEISSFIATIGILFLSIHVMSYPAMNTLAHLSRCHCHRRERPVRELDLIVAAEEAVLSVGLGICAEPCVTRP